MIAIGPLEPGDRAAWQELFEGYNTFYERTLPAETYDEKWKAFQADETIHALCARDDGGQVVGITHFFKHPSTSGPDVCYLQDLFTVERLRGKGIGRKLIESVYEAARAAGCTRVYWQTHLTNSPGRALYDKVGAHKGFIVYSKEL